ncbi:MAG: 3'-5' exonuclease [Victivallales bacterium]|nr:3'-5' exonuclease [Victivallales bacterium]
MASFPDTLQWHELGPFTIFDMETTGLSPSRDRIVELAAIRIDRDGVETRFQSLVNPGRRIPPAATRIHHITDDMVAVAPTFRTMIPEFMTLARDSTLVAHNARFDLGFLQEGLSRSGYELWKGNTMDTLKLTRTAFAGLPSYSLQSLRGSLQLPDIDGEAHRAGADVEWTLHLLRKTLSALLARSR